MASVPDSHFGFGYKPREPGKPSSRQPLLGWRCWSVTEWPEEHGPIILSSPQQGTPWTPRKRLDAITGRPPRTGLEGIHAAKTMEHMLSYMSYVQPDLESLPIRWGTVIGRVKLWGVVQEGEAGYRAQYAYPHSVYLPFVPEIERVIWKLVEQWGIKIETGPEADDVLKRLSDIARQRFEAAKKKAELDALQAAALRGSWKETHHKYTFQDDNGNTYEGIVGWSTWNSPDPERHPKLIRPAAARNSASGTNSTDKDDNG